MHNRSIKSFSIIFAVSILIQIIALVGNFSIQYLLDHSKKELESVQKLETGFFKVLSFENNPDLQQETSGTINEIYGPLLAGISSPAIPIDKTLLLKRKQIFADMMGLKLDQKKIHKQIEALLPNLAESIQYIHSHHIAYLRNIVSSGLQVEQLNKNETFKKQNDVSAPETHIIEMILQVHSRMHLIYDTFAKLQSGLSPAHINKEFNARINAFYKAVNRFEDYSLDAQDGILIEELLVNGRTFEDSFKKFLKIENDLINLKNDFIQNKNTFLYALDREKTRMSQNHQSLLEIMKTIRILSLLISIIMFCLLLGYAWIIISAFQRTVDETRKIQNNIHYNIPVSSKDFHELAFVFHALNSISETIREQMALLKNAKADLEKRVDKRTLELKELNQKLKKEIQDRIEGEQKRLNLEKRLAQAQRMESIGTLAGGIAHDFNNILSGMIGFAQLAAKHIDTDPEKAKKNIRRVHEGADRAAELIRQILTFSRSTRQDKKPLNLADIVKEVTRLIKSTIPAYIHVKEEILPHALIFGDSAQIHQVIMNLCTNAAQAMNENGGTLSVCLDTIRIDRPMTGHVSELLPGTYCHLKISDTGTGIDPENLDTIFEPYFTTKEIGDGTGLGLAIAHSIISEHQGTIDVTSQKGTGTQFDVYLPMTEQTREQPQTGPEMRIEQGTEHLMIVDDEKQIRESFKELFEDHGYTVSIFSDGPNALTAFQADPDQYQLIISDMTMPRMAGDMLVQKILEIRKQVPIILCTGFSDRAEKAKKLLHKNCHIFQKPVDTTQMSIKIRQLLELSKKVK